MKLALDYLKSEIARVEAFIAQTLQSDDNLMNEVGAYLAASKGKRLRPMLALLTARAQGVDAFTDGQIRVAASLELVHLATLLHDDVIDSATTRRGRPSVNAKWGDDVAILMADFLFSQAFSVILDEAGADALKTMANATSRMCEGEMFQIEKRGKLLSVDDYLIIIEAKTARLFSACAEMGVRIAGGSQEAIDAASSFGLRFGFAFQITDDTLDYTARGKQWGKSLGADITNGKQTLPFIHALDASTDEDRQFLLASLDNGGDDLPGVIERISHTGSIEHSLNVADQYAHEALEALAPLPDTKATGLLKRLANYVIERQY